MKFRLSAVGGVLAMWFALAAQTSLRAGTALTANDVIQNAVARGQQDQQGAVPDFIYRKLTMTEELDGAGKVKERREKVYEISYRDGLSHATLLQVNGHLPSEADLKKQSDNEMNIRQITGEAKSVKGDNRENFLTPELAARFDFRLLGETNLNGRATYLVSFQPKTPLPPARRVVDRLLNQISGKLWIDAEEFEVARAEVALRSEVNLLGGIIGSLKKLSFTLERTRVADGVWFSTLSSGDFQGRKLLDPTHIKTKSQSLHFRRLSLNSTGKLTEG
ncbi:MAG TPA: hypothetical protein VG938_01745 [Verrucomicrobiae bacterium]|nr:hypothetical protein [Verrucomicrobiae bacterium]